MTEKGKVQGTTNHKNSKGIGRKDNTDKQTVKSEQIRYKNADKIYE
ncbi:hypothetical protein AB1K99_00140 [Lederbergia ruris]